MKDCKNSSSAPLAALIDSRLSRRRGRPRIKDISAEIGAAIDSGHHDVGASGHNSLRARYGAIDRKTGARKLPSALDAKPERLIHGKAMRNARTVAGRRDNPNFMTGAQTCREGLKTLGSESIVIGNKNFHRCIVS